MRILPLLFFIILAGCCSAKHDRKAIQPDKTNELTKTAPKATAPPEGQMSPEMFRSIASAPGDDTPLLPKLAASGALWKNANVSLMLTYADGRTFNEDMPRTIKTVGGKYLVFTVQSKLYRQPMDSIVTYDEKTSAFKVWGIYGDIVTEGTYVRDFEKRIYAMSSSYGDGFTELGVGTFSDTMDSDRTLVFKNGTLVLTRETKTTPR